MQATKMVSLLETYSVRKLLAEIAEKAIDSAVKDYHHRLKACVSANGGHFEHLMS